MHLVPFGRSPITSGTYGTSVPGLGNTLALSAYLIDDGSHDLKGIGISSDAAYHYNLAIERGRGVVTYMASTENAAMIEEQFRGCGFVKIRRFPVNSKM